MNIQEHQELEQIGPMSAAEVSFRMSTMQVREQHAKPIRKAIGLSLVHFFAALNQREEEKP